MQAYHQKAVLEVQAEEEMVAETTAVMKEKKWIKVGIDKTCQRTRYGLEIKSH